MNCSGTRFLHADELGSIVAATDCSGNRTNLDTYDEYGIPGSSNWGRFQYTGQAFIPDIGMYYYKARLYSPTLGGSARRGRDHRPPGPPLLVQARGSRSSTPGRPRARARHGGATAGVGGGLMGETVTRPT